VNFFVQAIPDKEDKNLTQRRKAAKKREWLSRLLETLMSVEQVPLFVFVLNLCAFASLREIFLCLLVAGLPRYVICDYSGP